MSGARFDIPTVGAPSSVRFPHVHRRTFDNGARLWTLEQPASPVVTLACVIDGGVSADPADRHGLTSLTASLTTEGAGGLDSIGVSDALARIGGHLEVEPGADVTTIYLSVLSRHVVAGLALLADIVRRPTLADDDFARVHELRLSRLKQLSRTPATAADRTILAAVFGDHPYGHGALGTTTALEAMTVDDVRACWAASWLPARTTIVAVGNLDEAVADAAARAFGDWMGAGGSGPALAPPAERAESAGQVLVVHRAGAPQSEVRVGHLGPARRTPDYHALVTLNALVGGQFTSRINRNLREARAITYGARSAFEMRRAGGLFSCDASVQGDATHVALAEILRELREVAGDGAVTAEELERAQGSLTRGYVRHFETALQLARAMTQLATYALPDDTFDQFVPGVTRLSPADITRTARAALHPDRAALVVVGDLDLHRAGLESLGRTVIETKPVF